jgi:hypothetical protein
MKNIKKFIRTRIIDKFNYFFLINAVLFGILILFLFIRFKIFWIMLLFSLIIFVVRFRRQMLGIHLTLEPVILFSVIMLKLSGIGDAIIVIALPILISDIIIGRFRLGTLVSITCKVLVILFVYIMPGYNLILVTMIGYVVFNEILGTILALVVSTPIDQVITQAITSTLIRLFYLNVFLYPLCSILGAGC